MSQNNFPAGVQPPTGITSSMRGLTGSLASTVFFTAPVTGVFLFQVLGHIEYTDGTGTITMSGAYPQGAFAGQAISLSTNLDGSSAMKIAYLAAGQQFTIAAVATGLVATVYDIFLTAIRVL